MAKAVETRKSVTTETVTLTLSKEEAEALATLTGSIIGDSENGPRKHTDAVYYALSRQGITARYRGHLEPGAIRLLTKPKPKPYSSGYVSTF